MFLTRRLAQGVYAGLFFFSLFFFERALVMIEVYAPLSSSELLFGPES